RRAAISRCCRWRCGSCGTWVEGAGPALLEVLARVGGGIDPAISGQGVPQQRPVGAANPTAHRAAEVVGRDKGRAAARGHHVDIAPVDPLVDAADEYPDHAVLRGFDGAGVLRLAGLALTAPVARCRRLIEEQEAL